jgi:hypothetical protein
MVCRNADRPDPYLSVVHQFEIQNHCHALAIYFYWYNWVRVHKTLGVTPAMAAGLTDRIAKMDDIVGAIEADQVPKVRGPYKKRGICIHCQHPIGYHHLEGDKCSCKDCACPGYEGYRAYEISN